jgi:type I restriction enzyme M protein
MLNPQRKEMVLDPACGSGGFLLYALDHVRRESDNRFADKKSKDHFNFWHEFAEKRLFGIEINEELARVAKMNMIIHDDRHTNIVCNDALDFLGNISAKKLELNPANLIWFLPIRHLASVVKRTEKGEGYLEQFDLRNYINKSSTDADTDDSAQSETDAKRGARAVKERSSMKTEILFIERVHSYLKLGTGRAAIVLPDGILTNSSLQGVRDWILEHFQILAVVSLSQFAFAHYDAGVKASLVFLRRLKENEVVADDTPIFMALAENIGYDDKVKMNACRSVLFPNANGALVTFHDHMSAEGAKSFLHFS